MRINRRTFIGTVVAAASLAGVGASNRLAPPSAVRAGATRAARAALPKPELLALPLEGARVVEVHKVRCGALPVVLEHQGARFQIDVLKRDPAGPAGVFETDELAFFVSNGGDGAALTGETRELGARALGLALRSHDTAGLASRLSTFAERARLHGDGFFAVPSVANVRA